MKVKVNLFSVILFIMFNSNLISQEECLIVFSSYQEYNNGAGTKYPGDYVMTGSRIVPFSSQMNFNLRDKEKRNSKSGVLIKGNKKTWGFSINGMLFRINQHNGYPYRLVNGGKFCYYENGRESLRMLKKNPDVFNTKYKLRYFDEKSSWGGYCYLSKTVDSDMYDIKLKSDLKRIARKHPEFKRLYECVDPVKLNDFHNKLRRCAKSLN